MIADMGVKARDRAQIRTPRQKLRSAISAVQATVRMQKMVRDWKSTKKLGEGLKRAKDEVLRKRDSSISSKLMLDWKKREWIDTVGLFGACLRYFGSFVTFLRVLFFLLATNPVLLIDGWLTIVIPPFIYGFACMAVFCLSSRALLGWMESLEELWDFCLLLHI